MGTRAFLCAGQKLDKTRLFGFCWLVWQRLGAFLGAVSASGLFSAFYTGTVQGPPNHLIPNTGQVADTPASDQDNRVLLKVVPFARNIDGYFFPIRKPNTGDLSHRRIRLFGGHSPDLQAYPPFLGAPFKGHRLPPPMLHHSLPTYQLSNRGHPSFLLGISQKTPNILGKPSTIKKKPFLSRGGQNKVAFLKSPIRVLLGGLL